MFPKIAIVAVVTAILAVSAWYAVQPKSSVQESTIVSIAPITTEEHRMGTNSSIAKSSTLPRTVYHGNQLTLIFPDGGDVLRPGSVYLIQWTQNNLEKWGNIATLCLQAFDRSGNPIAAKTPAKGEPQLCYYYPSNTEYPMFIAETALSSGEYKWEVPSDIVDRFTEKPAMYTMEVFVIDNTKAEERSEWSGTIDGDENEGFFSITSPQGEILPRTNTSNDTGLPYRYEIIGGQVYLWQKPVNIPDIDVSTFATATKMLEGGLYFMKDKNNVYAEVYNTLRKLPDADPTTFMLLGCSFNSGCYAKDKAHVFYERGGEMPTIILGADVSSFQFVLSGLGTERQIDAIDILRMYAFGKEVLTQPKDNLQLIDGRYFKGIDGIYKQTQVSCGAKMCDGPIVLMDMYDLNSFTFLEACYSNMPADSAPDIYYYVKDTRGVYCGDQLVQDADPATFEVIGRAVAPEVEWVAFAKDKEHVFQSGRMLPDADPDTFEVPEVLELRG